MQGSAGEHQDGAPLGGKVRTLRVVEQKLVDGMVISGRFGCPYTGGVCDWHTEFTGTVGTGVFGTQAILLDEAERDRLTELILEHFKVHGPSVQSADASQPGVAAPDTR